MPTHCNVQLIIVTIVIHIIYIFYKENWHTPKPESTERDLGSI